MKSRVFMLLEWPRHLLSQCSDAGLSTTRPKATRGWEHRPVTLSLRTVAPKSAGCRLSGRRLFPSGWKCLKSSALLLCTSILRARILCHSEMVNCISDESIWLEQALLAKAPPASHGKRCQGVSEPGPSGLGISITISTHMLKAEAKSFKRS